MKLILSLLIISSFLIHSLQAQGYKEALEVGTIAPQITGLNQDNVEVDLYDVLDQGLSAVVIFYRGNWCGYCEKHLSLLQDSMTSILDEHATVIVVTPETPEGVETMIQQTGATFEIIYDKGYAIMKDYNVDYVISNETVFKYLGPVTKRTAAANGNDEGVLPVPATYIISPDRKISWVHFDPDYSKRSSVHQILQNLKTEN